MRGEVFRAAKEIDDPKRHVESQQPLVCAETHVPQPPRIVAADQPLALRVGEAEFFTVPLADVLLP